MKLRVALLALVALICAGVAYAAIPDSNGVIHGCYKNSTGMLKVIDSSSQACAASETALDWNQTGPQGPTGATGATGPTGPQGPAGQSAISLWAVVNSAGTLIRGSHAVSSTSIALGVYLITFDQDVSQCSYLATVNEDPGVTATAQLNGTTNVLVATARPLGPQPEAFSVAVPC